MSRWQRSQGRNPGEPFGGRDRGLGGSGRPMRAGALNAPAYRTVPLSQSLDAGTVGPEGIGVASILPQNLSSIVLETFQVYDDCISFAGIMDMTAAVINAGVAAFQGTPRPQNPGVITLDTGLQVNGGSEIVTNPQAPYAFLFGTYFYRLGFIVRIPTLSTVGDRFAVVVGFSDVFSQPPTNDGVYFVYSDNINGGNWQASLRVGGAATQNIDLLVAPTAGAFTLLEMDVDSTGMAYNFYIDGSLQGTFQLSTVITNTLPIKASIAKSTGTNSRKLDIDAYYIVTSINPIIVASSPSIFNRLG